MRDERLVAQIGEVATLLRGVTYKKQDSSDEPAPRLVPLLRATNIKGELNFAGLVYVPDSCVSPDQYLQPGDSVIAASSGSLSVVGKSAPLRREWNGTFGAFCYALRPTPEHISPFYLSYFLQTSEYRSQVSRLAAGVNINNLKRQHLEELDIPVVSLAEQHRIVDAIESYLTRLDDAVATLARVQRNLKRYRASVLKAAVEGRLVPTEAALARAEGRDYEPASVLLERILAERRRRWEAAELAKMTAKGKPPKNDTWKARYKEPVAPDTADLHELPEGWCWATWSQIGFSQNGRAFPSKQYSEDGVRLLRPGNLHVSGRVKWNSRNTRSMPAQWEADYPDYVVGPDELVMNLTAQSLKDQFLGRVCLTDHTEHCLLNQRIGRLTPILVRPQFILWWFKTPLFRRFVDGLNTGSLIQHMFTSQVAQFQIPLPPLAEQGRLVSEVERQLAIADVVDEDLERNAARVMRLRQSVLRWAFEGKLVDQDPSDEPAAVLLDRIKAEREAATATQTKPPRRRRKRSA